MGGGKCVIRHFNVNILTKCYQTDQIKGHQEGAQSKRVEKNTSQFDSAYVDQRANLENIDVGGKIRKNRFLGDAHTEEICFCQ